MPKKRPCKDLNGGFWCQQRIKIFEESKVNRDHLSSSTGFEKKHVMEDETPVLSSFNLYLDLLHIARTMRQFLNCPGCVPA